MTRGEFDRLVQRYRVGECTPEEIAFVEQWMKANGEVEYDNSVVFENETEALRIEDEVWVKIQSEAGLIRNKPAWKSRKWVWGSIAACLALITVSVLFLEDPSQTDSDPVMAGLETFNTSANLQRITLPDSSVITLAEGASVTVGEEYGLYARTVRLKGEAFFEIRRNPKIPFLVYSGDLVTEVLGTSFTIKPKGSTKTIEVSVASGKVSVYSSEKDRNQRRKGVIITPNQKAVYDTESKTIRQDLVDEPEILDKDIPKSAFNFDDAPVKTVLSTLQRSYGMEIVVSNPELNDCVFTGNLNGFDLFKQLEYICNIIGIRYEVRGTTIFLAGEGCGNYSQQNKSISNSK